jgi:two-component system response regulator AtoC/two-component system nitrogen regulation response regulator NtrX
MANAETLEISDFPEEISNSDINRSFDYNLPFRDAKKIVVDTFERDFVSRKLAENNGNISKTAEALGMHRQSLQQKIKDLNMKQS